MSWFNETAVGKTLKTALWIAVSAGVSYVASVVAKDPNLFGVTGTAIVNVVLYLIKNISDPKIRNI